MDNRLDPHPLENGKWTASTKANDGQDHSLTSFFFNKRQIKLTISVMTCLFLGTVCEIPKVEAEGSNESIDLGSTEHPPFFLSSSPNESTDEKIKRLTRQNEIRALEISELKRELHDTQQLLRNQMLAHFPTKHSSDRAKLALAGELIAAKENAIYELQEYVQQLENRIIHHQDKIAELEFSYGLAVDLADTNRSGKERVSKSYQNKIEAMQSYVDTEKEDLKKDLATVEKLNQQLMNEWEQKNHEVQLLEQEIQATKNRYEELSQIHQSTQHSLEHASLEKQEHIQHALSTIELEQALSRLAIQEKEMSLTHLKATQDEKDAHIKILQDQLYELAAEHQYVNDHLDKHKQQLSEKDNESRHLLETIESVRAEADQNLKQMALENAILENKMQALELQASMPSRLIEEKKALECERFSLLMYKNAAEEKQANMAAYFALKAQAIELIGGALEEKLDTIASLEQEKDLLRQSITHHENEKNDIHHLYTEKELESQSQIERLEKALAEAKIEREELEDKLQTLLLASKSSDARLSEHDQNAQMHMQQHRDLLAQIEDLTLQLEQEKDQKSLHEKNYSELFVEHQKEHEHLNLTENKASSIKEALNSAEEKLHHYQILMTTIENERAGELERYQHDIAELTALVETEKSLHSQLEEQFSTLVEANQLTHQQLQTAEAELMQLTPQLTELNETIEQHRNAVVQKEIEYNALKNSHELEIAKLNESMQSAHSNLQEGHFKTTELEKNAQEIAEREHALHGKLETLLADLENEKSQRFQIEREMDALSIEHQHKQQQLFEYENKLNELNEIIQQHQGFIAQKEGEQAHYKNAYEMELAKLDDSLQGTRSTLQEERLKILELTSHTQTLVDREHALSAQLESMKHDLENEKMQRTKWENEFSHLSAEHQFSSKKVQESETELMQLAQALQHHEAIISQKENETSHLKNTSEMEISQLREAKLSLKALHEQEKIRSADWENKTHDLLRQEERLSVQLEYLRNDLEKEKHQHIQLEQAYANLLSEHQQIEQNLHLSKKELMSMTPQLIHLNDEIVHHKEIIAQKDQESRNDKEYLNQTIQQLNETHGVEKQKLLSQQNQLKEQLYHTQESISFFDKKIVLLQDELQHKENELAHIKTDTEKLYTETHSLHANHTDIHNRNLNLEQEREQLRLQNLEYLHLVDKLTHEINEQKTVLKKMEFINSELSKEFGSMRRDYLKLIEKNSKRITEN